MLYSDWTCNRNNIIIIIICFIKFIKTLYLNVRVLKNQTSIAATQVVTSGVNHRDLLYYGLPDVGRQEFKTG